MRHKFLMAGLMMFLFSLSTFAQSGKCGDNLTWTLEDGTLTISGTGAMANYSYNSSPWFDYEYRSSISSVIISDGVTSIGNYAFFYCSNLTSVTISNSVTDIGDWAFYYCSSLTSITIPESVKSIGLGGTFQNCTSLQSVRWNAKDCTIEPYDGVHYSAPFYALSNITSFTFGENVETIPACLCSNLYGLTDVVIPNSVKTIGKWAFESCGLTSVTIPQSVTTIEDQAFYYCWNLTSIKVDAANAAYCDVDGRLYDKSQTTLIQHPIGNTAQALYLYTVSKIAAGAFAGCTNLQYISFPKATDIGNYAFENCTGLTSITIPKSVTSIGYQAFIGCNNLTTMTVEEGNTIYDSRDNCNAIIETASNTLVAGCRNSIIPNSVTAIGDYAFYGCTGLTSINIHNKITRIGLAAFLECTGLTSVTVPESVTTIGMGATFQRCTALKEVHWNAVNCTIEPHNEEMNYYYPPFSELGNITTFIFGQNVETIPNRLCYGLTGLTSITIPAKVTSIGTYAFSGCTGLTSLISKALTPPVCGEDVFEKVDKSIPLYVPDESTVEYIEADEWKEFKLIMSVSLSAIEDVHDSNNLNTASTKQPSKILRNGNIYILNPDGRKYNLQGTEVR